MLFTHTTHIYIKIHLFHSTPEKKEICGSLQYCTINVPYNLSHVFDDEKFSKGA